jgi:hypothetical protein
MKRTKDAMPRYKVMPVEGSGRASAAASASKRAKFHAGTKRTDDLHPGTKLACGLEATSNPPCVEAE